MNAYVVVSLFTGARTEELQALTWKHLDLDGDPPSMQVWRSFRAVVAKAGLDGPGWTPRELRHSFVSLLSSSWMAIEDISHLVGHASTNVTEKVYRKELRPVLTKGARAMDAMFDEGEP